MFAFLWCFFYLVFSRLLFITDYGTCNIRGQTQLSVSSNHAVSGGHRVWGPSQDRSFVARAGTQNPASCSSRDSCVSIHSSHSPAFLGSSASTQPCSAGLLTHTVKKVSSHHPLATSLPFSRDPDWYHASAPRQVHLKNTFLQSKFARSKAMGFL